MPGAFMARPLDCHTACCTPTPRALRLRHLPRRSARDGSLSFICPSQ